MSRKIAVDIGDADEWFCNNCGMSKFYNKCRLYYEYLECDSGNNAFRHPECLKAEIKPIREACLGEQGEYSTGTPMIPHSRITSKEETKYDPI